MDNRICPVNHIRTFLNHTADKMSSSRLFIYMTPPPPSKWSGLATINKNLTNQNSEGSWVTFPTGSTRAAAASYALAHQISMGTIMEIGPEPYSSPTFEEFPLQCYMS